MPDARKAGHSDFLLGPQPTPPSLRFFESARVSSTSGDAFRTIRLTLPRAVAYLGNSAKSGAAYGPRDHG